MQMPNVLDPDLTIEEMQHHPSQPVPTHSPMASNNPTAGPLFPRALTPDLVMMSMMMIPSSPTSSTSSSASSVIDEPPMTPTAQQLSEKHSHFPLTHPDYPNLSPFEVLLTIYTPILETLSNYLSTYEKLRLTHVSCHLRRLCHSYPSFWAHPDFHLDVPETTGPDPQYGIGKVYNLDALLSILPLEGRLVSLNVDWTAVTGYYLFKIVDKCAATLQHLSVRGCRKVSIKHHIVPHFVHQYGIEPYSIAKMHELVGASSGGWGRLEARPYRALKSLHAWKARGVRRKPFLIDRKEADGDEPTRYLTTLAAALGIFVDVGLCSTPKLRCPRRRDIMRRGKEKFCVPFDRRWRETNTALVSLVPSLIRHGTGRDVKCDGCGADVGERCEGCAVAMHCSKCAKTLCHNCAWTLPFSSTSSSSGSSTETSAASSGTEQGNGIGGGGGGGLFGAFGGNNDNLNAADIGLDADPTTVGLVPAMKPCCQDSLPYNAVTGSRNGDIYCEECFAQLDWGRCDGCTRLLCMKHEWPRRRTCQGGCGRAFCFPAIGNGINNGGMVGAAQVCEMGGVRECVGCEGGVCEDCRRSTSCPCQLCTISFYCKNCWHQKPFSCDGDLSRRQNGASSNNATLGSENGSSSSSVTAMPIPGGGISTGAGGGGGIGVANGVITSNIDQELIWVGGAAETSHPGGTVLESDEEVEVENEDEESFDNEGHDELDGLELEEEEVMVVGGEEDIEEEGEEEGAQQPPQHHQHHDEEDVETDLLSQQPQMSISLVVGPDEDLLLLEEEGEASHIHEEESNTTHAHQEESEAAHVHYALPYMHPISASVE